MVLSTVGYALISGAILFQGYFAFESMFLKERYERRKLIEELYKCFETSKLYRDVGKKREYPKLVYAKVYDNKITMSFSIPKGINPEEFNKKKYVFKQYFGEYIDMNIQTSNVVLKVYKNGLPNEFNYHFEDINTNNRLPIICGKNLEGELLIYDMVEHPHLLISGETGSGKSSQLRSILTTLIKLKKSSELKLILGDLKRSEFHLFKRIEHVEGVYHSANELRPILSKIKLEMAKRGNLLDEEEVNDIKELKKPLPYIVVCIDEVALLKEEKDIMDILEEISSIGRSLGIFIILSMQRPDSKLLDGKLKVNLTVRMGFKTADPINSNIIGTPGSERLNTPGRMILGINSALQEIQCPWLDNFTAKRLLEPYKKESTTSKSTGSKQIKEIMELFQNE